MVRKWHCKIEAGNEAVPTEKEPQKWRMQKGMHFFWWVDRLVYARTWIPARNDVPITATMHWGQNRPSPAKVLQKRARKAVSLRDLYASNRIFSPNTASKSHGRRQPCRGFLSCLAEKSLALKCPAVLNRRFLFAGSFEGRRNTGCISRTKSFLRTERFIQNRANP